MCDPASVTCVAVGSSNFTSATVNSLFMILVTEIGDNTFFIAAILAMKHGRLVVYAGAMGAVIIMHVLSSIVGFALPALLPRSYTHFASAVLFLYFGHKLLKSANYKDGEGCSHELKEAEEELRKFKGSATEMNEANNNQDGQNGGKNAYKLAKKSKNTEDLEVFVQVFTLTFLAEWGDRSQIATIALAASQDPYGIVLGGLVGHAVSTGVAVIGGKMLATKISERTVAIIGGVLFLFFGISALVFGPDESSG